MPIIDEAIALVIFTSSLASLGIDLRRWLPFLGRKVPPTPTKAKGPVVDV